MDQFFGRVVDVERKSEGSTLTADAGIGATTLTVADTTDFDETGGQVMVAGDVYDYDTIDPDANTLHLTTGLTVASVIDDPVDVFDTEVGSLVVEYVALVLLDDQDPADEPIEVSVQHGLVDYLQESIRGGAAEAVTLVRDGDDDLMIFQLDGKLASDLVASDAVAQADAAFTNSEDALSQVQFSIAVSDGRIDTYYQTTAPWPNGSTAHDADLGDLWYDTDSSPRVAYRWLGKQNRSWVAISDQSIVQALENAQSAQTTADGKITHFVGPTAPTAEGYGDIWTNTAQGNKKYYWDGDSWEPLVVGNAAIADELIGKIITGSLIRTATSGARVEIGAAGNGDKAMFYSSDGAYVGNLGSGIGYLGLASANGMYGVTVGGIANGVRAYGSGGLDVEGMIRTHGGGILVDAGGVTVTGGGVHVGGGGLTVDSGDLHAPDVYVDNMPTTSSAANTFMGASGRLQKSTSSRRYKDNIPAADIDVEAVLQLQPRTFTLKNDESDEPRVYVGFIAEEAAELGLTKWVEHDDQGRVDQFAYAQFCVAQQAVLQQQATQLARLKVAVVMCFLLLAVLAGAVLVTAP